MEPVDLYLVFFLDEVRYALRLRAVERVVRMVEVTPLPKAPDVVLGIVDVQSQIVTVVDVRTRFRLPARNPGLTDQLILARTADRPVAFMVDSVDGVRRIAEGECTAATQMPPGVEYLESIGTTADGLVLIHDLDRFLSLDEENLLQAALKALAVP